MVKPLNGNNCDTCPKRFKCLTSKQQELCPNVLGEDIEEILLTDWNYFYPDASCIIYLKNRKFKLNISTKELMKILKKFEFTTTSRRGLKIKEKKE